MCSLIIIPPSPTDLPVLNGKKTANKRSHGEVVDFVLDNPDGIDLPAQWHRYFLAQALYRPLLGVVAHRHEQSVIPQIITYCTRDDLCHTSPAIAAALMEPTDSLSRSVLQSHPRLISVVQKKYAACITEYTKSRITS